MNQGCRRVDNNLMYKLIEKQNSPEKWKSLLKHVMYKSARGNSKSPDSIEIIWNISLDMCNVKGMGKIEGD